MALSHEKKKIVHEMLGEVPRATYKEIAERVGCHADTVRKYAKSLKEAQVPTK